MFLKVVLFWFQGRGLPYKGGMPYVATDSKSLILGLSNEVSFVSELSLKSGQTTKNTIPKICCTKIPVHQCFLPGTKQILSQTKIILSVIWVTRMELVEKSKVRVLFQIGSIKSIDF